MSMSITLNEDTPLEEHRIHQHRVWVKREDLCWPYPPISKARGVWDAIKNRIDVRELAVVDTGKSVNGLLVTTIGMTFGKKIVVGYPRYKADPNAIPGPTLAIKSMAPSGAVELVPIQANRQFVMLAEMKRFMDERWADPERPWFLFPTGLRLPETVAATRRQVEGVVQTLGHVGCFVVPTGTGTHLAGVLQGFPGHVVGVQGYGRPEVNFRRDVLKMAGLGKEHNARLRVITSLCDYYEARPDRLPPWPANAFYEVKAYRWLHTPGVLESLVHPVVFWNIGQ